VVAVAVQNTFRIEMHQNDVFLFFLKIIFKISILKPFENIKKKLAKKKKPRSQTDYEYPCVAAGKFIKSI
jgi:hypothetical protein